MLDNLPPSVSTFGGDMDFLMYYIYWVVGAWFVAAEVLLFYFLVRYRRRPGQRAAWAPADTWRYSRWILIPAALVLACDLTIEAMSARVWAKIKEEIPEHPEVQIKITGSQFAWRFTYPGRDGALGSEDDVDSMGELYVPRGKVVRFQLESLDVLHSLWIPHLRLKQDAVPGRSIPGWFEATQEGKYPIVCAELCGVAHTYMKATLHVVSPESYAAWLVGKMKEQ